jgi:hypothetical protein
MQVDELVLLNNGAVEAVIVPAAGRVLQFRFWGPPTERFGRIEIFAGRPPRRRAGIPKAVLAEIRHGHRHSRIGVGHRRPFDGSPLVAVSNGAVVLSSAEDPTYRIRVTRVVELIFDEPAMRDQNDLSKNITNNLDQQTTRNMGDRRVQEPQRVLRAGASAIHIHQRLLSIGQWHARPNFEI